MQNAFSKPNQNTSTIHAPRRRYQRLDLIDHLQSDGPKRILSLDGGGVRTALTIAVLGRIEQVLKKRHGNHTNFRLADYFDLVGGASTGGIVAALIAASSFSITDIRETFFDIAKRVYGRKAFGLGLGRNAHHQFDGKRLDRMLEEIFGRATLSDERIATGLAIVSKRVDTDETLTFHNHPAGRFFNTGPHGDVGFRQYPLTAVLRSSTLVPEQFAPEQVKLLSPADPSQGVFVDSSMTSHNNPAFQLYLLSTGKNQGFEWKTGVNNLQVVSVGTGSLCKTFDPHQARQLPKKHKRREALASLIDDAEHTGELLMHLISKSTNPLSNDESVGEMRDARLTDEPKFTYQRFQARLKHGTLRETLGLELSARQLEKVRTMTDPDGLQIAYEIGQAVADKMVREEHFPVIFDLPLQAPIIPNTPPKLMPGPSFPQVPSVRTRSA